MTKVIGYVRVSTITQTKGHGIEYQIEAIQRYCKAQGYILNKIYEDRGASAYKYRPKYEQALKKVIEDPEIDGIVVNDLTRFGRSTQELLEHITLIDRKNKRFISIKDNIDISTSTGKLLLTMLSAIADYERQTILERMKAGREYARSQGKKFGRPKKEIDWEAVKDFRGAGVSWTKTAKRVGVSTATLINRSVEKGIK
jgi:DNA invertase Pin-like site-specific DNA recombinase